MRNRTVAVLAVVAIALSLFSGGGTARAYSIENGAGAVPTINMTSASVSIQGFFSDLQRIINQPSLSLPTSLSSVTGANNALQWFDAWLYGIAGFHVIGLLNVALTVLSWLLGTVKGIVDWLLTVL